MKRATHFLRLIHRPLIGWVAIALILVGVGVGLSIRDAQNRKDSEAKALASLSKEQEAKSRQKTKPALHSEEHSDTLFADISDKQFIAPSCGRLQNRVAVIIVNTGCNYRLRALDKTKMAVVFIGDNPQNSNESASYETLKSNEPGNPATLSYINTYLANQAKRFNVSNPPEITIESYGPYYFPFTLGTFDYRTQGAEILKLAGDLSSTNGVPEGEYDMVTYIYLRNSYGGAAMPSNHRSFAFNAWTVPTFVHETLHLFGASDKYNNNDCSTKGQNDPFGRYNGTLPGQDIMCSNFDLNASLINDITAREIGWQN